MTGDWGKRELFQKLWELTNEKQTKGEMNNKFNLPHKLGKDCLPSERREVQNIPNILI